ncbi:MAG: VWA domain-containing protein [Verrucomicrobia bacterium]|nr:VWA domain-containing protein [Verrucomicrobiota bacterium]
MKTQIRIQFEVLYGVAAAFLTAATGIVLGSGTDKGEIQKRPAPVYRCPGLPCTAPNVFNISVAVHFDATPAELTAIEGLISAGSAMLFDVTDGQAEIGEAFICNNAFGGSAAIADLHIYPGSSDTWWQANTGGWKVGGGIHVSINRVLAETAPGESFAHEFVHLVFDARDEYETLGGANASCPDAAAIAAGEASCLMDQGGTGVADGPHSELCWGHGTPANLTDTSGGNHDANLVTEQSQSRNDRSCWDQVVWSWPDHFTKPAGAPDPAAAGAVVDSTHFLLAQDTTRVVLVLDESGSMNTVDSGSQTRLQKLQVAAKDFVALAEDGTELGIVSYSDDADPAHGHAGLAIAGLNATHRANCTSAIDGLGTGGWTSIGDGLRRARNLIISGGGVTANTYIVLMTDGLNNRPSPGYAADLSGILADLLTDGVPVYVTCTGGDLGLASQCSEIATATGGFYVDSADSADLPQAFADFHEKISGRQGVGSATGELFRPTVDKVFVEEGSQSATFALMWNEQSAEADLTIIGPGGSSFGTLPMPQGRYLRLKSPEPGEYIMMITNRGKVSGTYVARAWTGNQTVSVIAAPRHQRVLPGEPVYVYAYPRSLGGAITHPTNSIVGTVRLPNGQRDVFELHDRGPGALGGGDDRAGDGTFTGVYTNTSLKGPYQFLVGGKFGQWPESTDKDGPNLGRLSPRFEREVRLSAAVGDPSDVVQQPTIVLIGRAGSNVVITFTGTLQYTEKITAADWFPLSSASPHTVVPAEATRFYRAMEWETCGCDIDFQTYAVGLHPNPWQISNCEFHQSHPASPTIEIAIQNAIQGLRCGQVLEVTLAHRASTVEVSLLALAEPPILTPFDGAGAALHPVTASTSQQVQTLVIPGPDISRVRVDSPQNEVWMLHFHCQ